MGSFPLTAALELTPEVMVLWESSAVRQCSSWTLCDCFCWLLLPVTLLIVARPDKLAAFPTSLSDCQTPTGWNCSGKLGRERGTEMESLPLQAEASFFFPGRAKEGGYEGLGFEALLKSGSPRGLFLEMPGEPGRQGNELLLLPFRLELPLFETDWMVSSLGLCCLNANLRAGKGWIW